MTIASRRGTIVALAVVLAVGALIASGAHTAGASCVGAKLSVDPSAAPIGASVEVRGTGFGTACNDSGGSGPTLGRPDPQIQLRVVQRGLSIPLARVGANDDYELAVRVTVPGGLVPGPASIEATTSSFPATPTAIEIRPRVGPPVDEPPPTVVRGTTYGIERAHSDDGTGWIIAAVVGLALVAIGAVVVLRRRS